MQPPAHPSPPCNSVISAAGCLSEAEGPAPVSPHSCLRSLRPGTGNSRSPERERLFGAQSVPVKCLLSLSLCGTFPFPRISFYHLYSLFNILFCYKTANRPIYIIKLPEYFIALGFSFGFESGPRTKINDTQSESFEGNLIKAPLAKTG